MFLVYSPIVSADGLNLDTIGLSLKGAGMQIVLLERHTAM